jgi:hypothetical protein
LVKREINGYLALPLMSPYNDATLVVGVIYMGCPNCLNRKYDVYEARGFTSKESPIKECECGHIWRVIPLAENNIRTDVMRHGGSDGSIQ